VAGYYSATQQHNAAAPLADFCTAAYCVERHGNRRGGPAHISPALADSLSAASGAVPNFDAPSDCAHHATFTKITIENRPSTVKFAVISLVPLTLAKRPP
jgi:hypothetical protein